MIEEQENNKTPNGDEQMVAATPVAGLFENWFLEYASYVILDRAVPYIEDGLKPVQRRILHAMREMEDGRYNKVANIIGQTMQYHPHGDASIGDAITNLGQKELLIDTQGNWGNILTGDRAAAPRYIEARLSKFALEVVFNPKTTNWQLSYDGRKNEPVTLPVKFPLVLAQGVDGIAVGLSTKIMPHNFVELCEASIAYLKKRSFNLYPDFMTGGMIDVEGYNDGGRGGKIRVRARIEILDKKTLVIREVPFGTTTSNLIDSILKANDKGKIKLRKVDDNTARDVEIVIHLPNGVSPDITIDALYAFTDCEVSISPNCCIIIDEQPVFSNVRDVLKMSTDKTVALLKLELEIKKAELQEKWHLSSLEKIFIENRIYRDIEECETWEAVISTIDAGLAKYVATPSTVKPNDKRLLMVRDINEDDIVRLTEIKIKRISKFDSFKADELIKSIEEELEEVQHHLDNLIDFAVNYFRKLIEKYGKGRERRTEIRAFDTIAATKVVLANEKLYVDRVNGFVGTGLKKEEFVCECSDLDDIIVFREDGSMKVVKVADKVFIGKGIIYAGVFDKNDDRMVFHLIYLDKKDKRYYIKRFRTGGVTRDKEYFLTKSNVAGQVLYFTANPNGESEVVTVYLKHKARIRALQFDFDFAELAIKGRGAGGNVLSKNEIKKIVQKSRGVSTLSGRDIWFDPAIKRLNTDGNGTYLGNFQGDDRIVVLFEDGSYELTNFDLTNRYEGKGKVTELAKLRKDTVISAIHYDGKSGRNYIKRFQIETTTLDTKFSFITEDEKSNLIFATAQYHPVVNIIYNSRKVDDQEVKLEEFIDVKGWKAVGNKLSESKIKEVELESFTAVTKEWEMAQRKGPGRDEEEDEADDDEADLDPSDEMDDNEAEENEDAAEGSEPKVAKPVQEIPKQDPKSVPFEIEDKREEKKKGNDNGTLTLF
ncbi:MAG: DNA gyrase/topoisomerase IV subunit A [Bacteroidia bacterium]|nr:DNA gyrase/topoisomerase IV subunit A [Bacteroidia bacterium]